jgi:murein DD-endopeptidase MepM/ murein hydrolase activator NlpD
VIRSVKFNIIAILFLILLGIGACSQPEEPAAPTDTEEAPVDNLQPDLFKTEHKSPETAALPSAMATVPSTPTTLQNASPVPSQTPAVTEVVEIIPCEDSECHYSNAFFLQRPISADQNDSVDVTYRFGSTQGGRREPHHGVEFLNSHGTPVLAAGEGMVIVAGSDVEPHSERGVWPLEFFGPYGNFYGNLVVVEHMVPEALLAQRPEFPEKVFSVYGHLSEISVESGQPVTAGEEIGKVGLAGIAEGSHLHFEVRESENKYPNSRNPELFLQPHKNETGELNGALAVSITDEFGQPLAVESIVLEHISDQNNPFYGLQVSLQSYAEKGLLGAPPWGDSFGVGDIPPGKYRLTFPYYGLQEYEIEIRPEQLTLLTLDMQ